MKLAGHIESIKIYEQIMVDVLLKVWHNYSQLIGLGMFLWFAHDLAVSQHYWYEVHYGLSKLKRLYVFFVQNYG